MKRILVIDDQPGIRLLLTDILSSEGYQIMTAATGKEALDKIYSNTFDLIILDYNIPIIDGAKLLETLEKEKKEVSAIVISGLTEKIMDKVNQSKSVKRVIAKPFNISDFRQQVNAILLETE
ncbi:response regulator [Oceanobacillus zhaokaii]|uniref:Response regulator n=1 Tax=Oceanobacillus zhaokaii TaxID=2052660 RepID=A0A345PKX1_9BACI|nr:response regulator [Oceanobacillus zhaokaii]AXI10651.1 response regulator [Oceanobacillus zhaokaii]